MNRPEPSAHFSGKVTLKAVLFGPDGDILVTRTDDWWTVPGGTFERGETLIGGLRRELREELGVQSRVGPPVEAMYGAWIDESESPMVAIIYRAETDERAVTLNEEHDEYAWVTPEERAELLRAPRLQTAIRRAAAVGDEPPFSAVADPYHDHDRSTEEILEQLAAMEE